MSVSNNELGELLIDLGLLSPEQLSDAIVQQQNSGTRLTVVLSDMGLITERQLKDALELQYGVNFVNLSSAPPESEYVRLVPEEIERQFRFVPVSMQGNQFTVAMVDPDDLVAAEAIREHLSSTNFKKLVCTADDFEHLMYTTYEAPTEAVQELDEEGVDENDFSSASPRASQTKLKAHMRNLFESDSDDDLDSMFGKSSDSLPALKESDIEPVQETVKQPKKSKKAISKKITSLFDDDDDDFGDDDLSSPAAPETEESAEFAQVAEDAQLPEEEGMGAEEEISEASLKSRPELTAEIESGESPGQEETMPSNQLLEHILQEAGVPRSKPKKMKPKKKSMQSLFDDDNDDMDFSSESAATTSAEPTETTTGSLDADPSSAAESFDDSGETTYSDSEADSFEDSLNSESLGSDSYTGGSLTGEDSYSGGLLTGLDSEHDQSPSEFDSEPAIEGNEPERAGASSKKSAAKKAFRSLFDDEMDEDDLFGSDAEQQTDAVQTEEPSDELQYDGAPDTVASFADGSTSQNDLEPNLESEPEPLLAGTDFDGTQIEPTEEEQESAESLMSAIERPFQSLFDDDDEDDEDLFGKQNTLENAEETFTNEDDQFVPSESLMPSEETLSAEPQAEEISEMPSDIEPSMAEEISPTEEDESIKPAYHASFDDEMDEDSLFASASHPIPEGAPHLRDLLSRFDDSDAAFDALEDSLNKTHPEVSESAPQPEPADAQDAELAVSALIAALDEQVPDEEISIPPRHENLDEQVAGDQDSVSMTEHIDAEQQPLTHAEPFEDSPHHESTEPVASLPEVSQEVPAITPPANKPVANPKSKKLRALIMDDDDDFGLPEREEVATVTSDLDENTGRAEFDEVLPLDKEDLTPLSNATSELPPVVVSRSAKTMTSGTSPREEGLTPAVSSFDEVEHQQSKAISSLEETLPPPSMSPRTSEPVPARSHLEVDTSVSMPDTAAELPDALDDVLSSVTNDLIDNVELANLSGNRTEISFLEEIVESELALENQSAAQSQPSSEPQPATPPVQSPPVVQTVPAVQESPAIPAAPAAQTVQTEMAPAPQQVPPVTHNTPAAAEPVTQPAVAQTSAAQATPASKDLSVSQAAVDKLNLDPSILNLATQILTQAVNSPCSDVHFEPLADGLALRFMSDGDLLDETILPAQIQGMLILCLKSMAGLDPKVVDRPQDKRFITSSFGDPVEMRITSIPGMHGEMVAVSLKS